MPHVKGHENPRATDPKYRDPKYRDPEEFDMPGSGGFVRRPAPGPIAIPTPTPFPLPTPPEPTPPDDELPKRPPGRRDLIPPDEGDMPGSPGFVPPGRRPPLTPTPPSETPGDKSFNPAQFDAGLQQIEDSVFSGNGTFPKGLLKYQDEKDENGNVIGRVLTPESQQLWDYWREIVADRQAKQDLEFSREGQQQTFLTMLLQNPGALAAFQLMRGQGQPPFGGGGGGFFGGWGGGGGSPFLPIPNSPLPSAAGRLGFNPYQQVPGIASETEGDMPGSSGVAGERRLAPIGTPLSGLFSGGVPHLGALGTQQDINTLLPLLALFGIDPQQFQQGSAMATPRPLAAQGGRIALPSGRR